MKAFLLITPLDYEPTNIHGIYSSEEKARMAAEPQSFAYECEVLEFEVDAIPLKWMPDPVPSSRGGPAG